MSTILVTGANGQLGNEMRNMSLLDDANKYIFTDVRELDITDLVAVQNFLSENAVDFIVNCAAYTAVDKAESEIELCRKINAFAVENLAKASASVGAKMIHVSTDYVYSGTHYMPYVETDAVGSCVGLWRNQARRGTAVAGGKSEFGDFAHFVALFSLWK